MRRYHKRLVIEMLESLYQSCYEIKSLNSNIDRNKLTNALADMQDAIEQIYNFFNQREDIEFDLFEKLQQLYKSIFIVNDEYNSKTIEYMTLLIVWIKEYVERKIIANKIEVAFLPYCASMFDALESIWSTASTDPECDAYLIPIPYYTKNSKGEFQELKYDGECYKQKYEITNWREYNLQERHPDIIYIHNPYDGCNLVTSIHPDFYSSKIKEYTELLAYIPYFISCKNVEEHFIQLPGSIWAHKIFVQSEIDRGIYMEHFSRALNTNRDYWKDKFVAIGSPKIDKVLNSEKEDYKILPSKWSDLIVNYNGMRKVVILYNTTLSQIISKGEAYLLKLESVFRYFKERKDVVLWWRPHPLSEATYQSMNPKLYERYKRLITQYKEESYGIYDDTYDLHRAIAISDAYYGDSSSVVGLYGFTNKIIMYQNIEIVEYNKHDNGLKNVARSLLQSYKDNKELSKDLYIIWEYNYAFLDALVNNTVMNEVDDCLEELLKNRKELFETILISNEGKTGEKIFNYCKKEVLK